MLRQNFRFLVGSILAKIIIMQFLDRWTKKNRMSVKYSVSWNMIRTGIALHSAVLKEPTPTFHLMLAVSAWQKQTANFISTPATKCISRTTDIIIRQTVVLWSMKKIWHLWILIQESWIWEKVMSAILSCSWSERTENTFTVWISEMLIQEALHLPWPRPVTNCKIRVCTAVFSQSMEIQAIIILDILWLVWNCQKNIIWLQALVSKNWMMIRKIYL